MNLQGLTLVNYKNFESREFQFDQKINCFVGANGVGKTNILDAIYHLAFAKSYFNPVSTQNILHGQDFFLIDGFFRRQDKEERVQVSLKKGQKKKIKRNGKDYDRFSDHIGFIPLVIISPADQDLISEGSDTRRKFMDTVISQRNKRYLATLISYNKVLSQRNALLKYFAANNTFNAQTLEIYDSQLEDYGTYIHEERLKFLEVFIPIFKSRYAVISKDREMVNIVYKSDLDDGKLSMLLKEALQKDKVLQYTSVGTHKDDLKFEIGDYPVKKFGSQGQQKSYLVALKLAQFEFLKSQSGVTPILLLDDIFDKLDETRVAQIISLVEDENFGQLFISDTNEERTEQIVKQVHQSYKIFSL
jgi:DNA replication and repair protein RecF